MKYILGFWFFFLCLGCYAPLFFDDIPKEFILFCVCGILFSTAVFAIIEAIEKKK